MATEVRKVLGQSYPNANTLTALYAVPAATQAVSSCISACNQSATAAAKIRISVAVAGAADTPSQYIAYDVALDTNETRAFQIGMTLGATDNVRIMSDTGFVSFTAFGVELA